jgi:cation diffusion facilitator CzcD-associated flavoprotein CzcO
MLSGEAYSDVIPRYPGARVDSEWPFYQLSLPQVWRGFNFSQRFPDHVEIRSYFKHMVDVLDLRKDITFNARVNSAEWSEDHGKWTVKTEAGHQATGKFLFLCSGLLHRRHYPDIPGLSSYKGIIHHSGFWPEDLDLTGKRVCVIGMGATSVQIVQEVAKKAGQLTVLMRRPSLCLPIRNRNISEEEQQSWKEYYPAIFKESRLSTGGFPFHPPTESVFQQSDEERNAHYESLWKAGAFAFGAKNFPDVYTDLKANRIAYDFWAEKTRARISDPKKRDLMVPLEPPYPILTKRAPLENDYYEMIDQPNVNVEDLNQRPIQNFTEGSILFDDGTETPFDCVILATGYDSFSGSYVSFALLLVRPWLTAFISRVATMGLKNKSGRDLKDVWSEQGISTYLGMLIRGFPNCFMCYSPQGKLMHLI